jgi:integrase
MPQIFQPGGEGKFVMFYTDHTGRRRKATLAGNKETSECIARDILNNVQLRKRGPIDDRDEKFAEHEGTPLKEHLDHYLRAIASEGVTDKHIGHVKMVITEFCDLGKIRRISDLTLSAVQEVVAKLRQTRATETINARIQRIKSFSRWLGRDKRARKYTLVDLHRKDAKHDRRHVRRRVTDAEVMAVIAAAESGKPCFNLSGPDRAMPYRIAYGTGFRAKELRSLTPEQFRLNDDAPTVTCSAAYTKNREKATQPIQAGLALIIRPWLATKPAKARIFGHMGVRTPDMLKFDLDVAGVPYETPEGKFDFHASRVTYISNLVSGGASVKTCQVLARHSDPSLTIAIYAKTSLHDV